LAEAIPPQSNSITGTRDVTSAAHSLAQVTDWRVIMDRIYHTIRQQDACGLWGIKKDAPIEEEDYWAFGVWVSPDQDAWNSLYETLDNAQARKSIMLQEEKGRKK
jgi:hypothetical protein